MTANGINFKFYRELPPTGIVFKNENGDEAVFSFNKKKQHLFGTINTHDEREFEIERCHNGHVFKEINVTTLEPRLPIFPETTESLSLERSTFVEQDNATIVTYSIIFYYTQEFAFVTADIEGFVDHIIDITNEGYANSQIPVRVKAFCIEAASLSDTTGNVYDFRLMKGSSEATLNTADAAVLLVKYGLGYCGVAFLVPAVKEWVFSVTAKGCISSFVVGHELGHNFGAHHDIYDAYPGGVYSYGYGHHIERGSFSSGAQTILAYYRSGYGVRVNYYSNPSVVLPLTGTPTGVEGVSNNAAVIMQNRFTMAANGDESGACSAPTTSSTSATTSPTTTTTTSTTTSTTTLPTTSTTTTTTPWIEIFEVILNFFFFWL